MAEGSFKGLVIGFILIGVFMFAMLTFAISIATDYGYDDDDITGGVVDLENIESYLEGVDSNSKAREDQFRQKGLFSIGGSDVLTAIWDVTVGLGVMITTPFSYVAQILLLTFKVPYLIISVLMGIMILIIIFAVWRLVKVGE